MWNQYYLMIYLKSRQSKMSSLPLFQMATRLRNQNPYENEIRNEWEKQIFLWISVIKIVPFEVSTTRKWRFFLYFSSIHDYRPSNALYPLVHYSKWEMERCEKVAFQLIEIRKMNIRRNIKIKNVTFVFLSVRSSNMKDYTCHTGVIS
jgi:hypothetical protein